MSHDFSTGYRDRQLCHCHLQGSLRGSGPPVYSGRPIVPIIGAGFFELIPDTRSSTQSVVTLLDSSLLWIITYYYLFFRTALHPRCKPNCKKWPQRSMHNPIRYIEQFGWPDRFDLNQRVARYICAHRGSREETDHELIEKEITEQYSWLAEKSASPRAAGYWQKEILGKSRLAGDALAWDRWAVQGDWRRLLQFFTEYKADYADDLFARFGHLRTPGAGQRYITLLTKLLSIRTIFTFNFDDLIEKALTLEGMAYRVFGMEHGRTLPSPRVAGEVLSVIKMHGSHHSVLIDERLDRPLDRPYIDRFYDLAGHDCLLLVLGCSGDDRRLERPTCEPPLRPEGRDAEICWVYFERDSPIPARARKGEDVAASPIFECPTSNPAAFIRHLLFYISGRFPSSPYPYATHPSTPTLLEKPDKSRCEPYPRRFSTGLQLPM